MARAAAAAVAAVLLAGCGGNSGGDESSKAAWIANHGDAVAALNTDLEVARSTLSSLLRPDILGSCNQLRDSLAEAGKGLPVPDPATDAALRTALDAVAVGPRTASRAPVAPTSLSWKGPFASSGKPMPSWTRPTVRSRLGGSWIRSCSTRCYGTSVSREISQRELRNDSGEIMRRLDEGETFIVTRNGVPVGELSPLRRHRFVAADAAVAIFRAAPPVDYERFRRDLDVAASQEVSPPCLRSDGTSAAFSTRR
jgi:antitoxin (DNA-binding transcriptional repressor) of toxin-antitoxin stability system